VSAVSALGLGASTASCGDDIFGDDFCRDSEMMRMAPAGRIAGCSIADTVSSELAVPRGRSTCEAAAGMASLAAALSSVGCSTGTGGLFSGSDACAYANAQHTLTRAVCDHEGARSIVRRARRQQRPGGRRKRSPGPRRPRRRRALLGRCALVLRPQGSSSPGRPEVAA
jgi:hypothetical protein